MITLNINTFSIDDVRIALVTEVIKHNRTKSIEDMAPIIGISPRTLHRWIKDYGINVKSIRNPNTQIKSSVREIICPFLEAC